MKQSSPTKKGSAKINRWLRLIHRDLSFFFAGVIIIYALSGIMMNHRSTINPHYSVTRQAVQFFEKAPISKNGVQKDDILKELEKLGEKNNYTKHFFPSETSMKVFLKGGSTIEVDLSSGNAVYDRLRKRPLLSQFVRLHYNPGHWWTYFSDLFALSLIIITLTGLFLVKGKRGLKGRGGILFLIGIAIPIAFLLL